MNTKIMIIITVLVSVGLVAGASIYYASLFVPDNSDQAPTDSSTSPNSLGQLKVNNLLAFSDGTVSLNITLYDCESGFVEAVMINGTSYLWSDGSVENGTILKGQTKSWVKNIGSLTPGNIIEVALKGSFDSSSGTVTVDQPPIPEAPDAPEKPELPSYVYDYYSGVGLFDRGVYFVATSQDPLTQLPRSDLPKSYWALMHDNLTSLATSRDFISILVSRGDFPTGGYTLQVEAFSWLESDTTRFRFQVNFTDPGEGVAVTQAFTNPLLLVPIGTLPPGQYEVEVHIVSYILTFDEQGKPNYRQILTFREEVWTQAITINSAKDPMPSATFKVTVNTTPVSDLTVPIDLSSGVTREQAQEIADATFIHVKGEKALFRLDDLTFNENRITARYTWGVDENDMGHIFELTADLATLQITVTHCL